MGTLAQMGHLYETFFAVSSAGHRTWRKYDFSGAQEGVGASTAESALRTAAVITEFAAERQGDLELRVGDVVVLTKAPKDKQWWKGYIEGENKRKGVFPCMFVKEIGAAPRSPNKRQ